MSDTDQMKEIEKLYAKPKTYKIPEKPKEGQDQANIEISPIGLDELALINIKEDSPMNEIAKNVKTLFSKSLNITEDQAGKLSFVFMGDLMNAVMDVNEFSKDDMQKTGIKTFLENKRKQIKDQKDPKKAEEPDKTKDETTTGTTEE